MIYCSRSVKVVAWSLLALVCIWTLTLFVVIAFGSILAAFFSIAVSPLVLGWAVGFVLPFVIFSGLLAFFYVRVAISDIGLATWRVGWIASAIYHFALLEVSAVYVPGSLSVGPIEGSFTFFCAAATVGSVYALCRGRVIPPLPASGA